VTKRSYSLYRTVVQPWTIVLGAAVALIWGFFYLAGY
jgi:hypothetical protein